MLTYLVHSRGVNCQVRALNHQEAARKSGLVAGGEILWVDGPVDEFVTAKATIHFSATSHKPPHLRRQITYHT